MLLSKRKQNDYSHGHAGGIYIRDPDGNGIWVSYEMPCEEWDREGGHYTIGTTDKNRLPNSWDYERTGVVEAAVHRPLPNSGRWPKV